MWQGITTALFLILLLQLRAEVPLWFGPLPQAISRQWDEFAKCWLWGSLHTFAEMAMLLIKRGVHGSMG